MLKDSQADQDCYYETHVKGTDLAMVHTAFRDVDIEISRSDSPRAASLLPAACELVQDLGSQSDQQQLLAVLSQVDLSSPASNS